MKIIQDIFSLILKFRSQLVSSSWERNGPVGEVTHPNFAGLVNTYRSFHMYSFFLFRGKWPETACCSQLTLCVQSLHLNRLLLLLFFVSFFKLQTPPDVNLNICRECSSHIIIMRVMLHCFVWSMAPCILFQYMLFFFFVVVIWFLWQWPLWVHLDMTMNALSINHTMKISGQRTNSLALANIPLSMYQNYECYNYSWHTHVGVW